MMQSKYLCIDLRTCALIVAAIDALSTILVFFTVGLLFSLAKLVVTGTLLYGIIAKKPQFLIPFLITNCLVIIMALIGIVTKFVIASDTTYDGDEFTTPHEKTEDPMKRHKTLYTLVAVLFILINCHAWLVIFALYKQDSSSENKIVDSAMAAAISNYPPLQNVSTGVDSIQSSVTKIDDGLRFAYK